MTPAQREALRDLAKSIIKHVEGLERTLDLWEVKEVKAFDAAIESRMSKAVQYWELVDDEIQWPDNHRVDFNTPQGQSILDVLIPDMALCHLRRYLYDRVHRELAKQKDDHETS